MLPLRISVEDQIRNKQHLKHVRRYHCKHIVTLAPLDSATRFPDVGREHRLYRILGHIERA